MRIIGLTGGIACGKSNISEELRQEGAFIVDGDLLSRELTAPEGAALAPIKAHFGAGVFRPDGTLDRKALGAAIFADEATRAALDGIMQPMLLARIREEIDRARRAGAEFCVLDMPLLFEAGLDALCDRVWCAYIPQVTQVARLMARDSLTEQQAMQRLHSQMDTAEKAARADVVIDTSGSIGYTRSKIAALLERERGIAQAIKE